MFGLDGELIKTVDEKVKSETTNTVGGGGLDVTHIANFFNAIRLGEKLNAPIEDASISTMMCHLGNIAQDVGETINIDPKTGKIEGNKRAMKNWKRDYEKGWEPKL